MLTRLPIIGIMGSHAETHATFATAAGRLVAELGCHLLTGGGPGVMYAACEAFTAAPNRRGLSLGIIPTTPTADGGFAPKPGYPNPFVEIPITTPLGSYTGDDTTQISRNHINIMSSDIILALPGSKGTANEIELALLFNKPLIFFGPMKAFSSFAAQAPQTEDEEILRNLVARIVTAKS